MGIKWLIGTFVISHAIGIPLALVGDGNVLLILMSIAIILTGEIAGLLAMIFFAAGIPALLQDNIRGSIKNRKQIL